MEERISTWYTLNNEHPCDNNRFFDIVIESMNNKLDFLVFQNALKECNNDISDDEIATIYRKYELLHSFLRYYNNLVSRD